MKCPRDGQPLVFVDEGRHMRDRCAQCEGVLLDRDEVRSAIGRRGGKGGALPQKQLAALPQSGLECPRDGATMRRLMHREVELDLCPECGALWVDHGELDKILHKKPRAGKAALAAAGALAAGAAAAATPEKQSLASGVGEVVREVAVEGAIDVVFEFAVDAIGALFS